MCSLVIMHVFEIVGILERRSPSTKLTVRRRFRFAGTHRRCWRWATLHVLAFLLQRLESSTLGVLSSVHGRHQTRVVDTFSLNHGDAFDKCDLVYGFSQRIWNLTSLQSVRSERRFCFFLISMWWLVRRGGQNS